MMSDHKEYLHGVYIRDLAWLSQENAQSKKALFLHELIDFLGLRSTAEVWLVYRKPTIKSNTSAILMLAHSITCNVNMQIIYNMLN